MVAGLRTRGTIRLLLLLCLFFGQNISDWCTSFWPKCFWLSYIPLVLAKIVLTDGVICQKYYGIKEVQYTLSLEWLPWEDAWYDRGNFFFFVHAVYYLRPSFSPFFSLPPCGNSDPGSHIRLFSLPTTVRAFAFLSREDDFSPFSSLVDSRRTAVPLFWPEYMWLMVPLWTEI